VGCNVAQLPGQQYAYEQHYRYRYPRRQRTRHALVALLCRGLGASGVLPCSIGRLATSAQHKEKRRTQAGKDGEKSDGDEKLHRADYPVMSQPVPTLGQKTAQPAKGRARVLLAVLTLLAMLATALLGGWQLQRASTKETLAAQMDERNTLPALTKLAREATQTVASSASQADAAQALVHRRVQLRGVWLTAHTVFLDNRYMAGRPGFLVVTPLQLESSAHAVWVQRGWVPRDPTDRTRLPKVPTPTGTTTVEGRVVQEISRVYALGEGSAAPTNAITASTVAASSAPVSSAPNPARASRIWQNLPAVDLGAQTQWLSVAVLQTAASLGDAPDGLLRDWPAVDAGVAKHYGYAFQWFALCGLIMVLYVWFQLLSPRRRKA
jgi:surfeit locus 1 family protein